MTEAFFEFSAKERLFDRWHRHATDNAQADAIIHWIPGEDPVRWTWERLLSRAHVTANWLISQGVGRNEVCALIIRHHPQFYPLYLSVSMCGALPAVLAYPNSRLHPDKFREGLEGMAQHSGLDWILTERDLEPVLRELAVKDTSTVKGMLFPLEWDDAVAQDNWDFHSATASASDPCLLQHSSGTTGLQRAIVLSHDAVLGHIQRYGRAIDLGPGDKILNWLPLYHDMGLIAAFHLALGFGIPIVQIDPFDWVQAPVLMLEAASHEKCTLAWLPNFAYHLMADRIHDEDVAGLRLDCLRMLINCSEPVRAEAHAKFGRRFARYGIRPEALTACYAMAETTFAVTQTEPRREARQIHVDRSELSNGIVELVSPGPNARTCVSSGRTIEDVSMRVVDGLSADLADDRVGELVIRSASMFNGYRNNPTKTAEVLKEGWLFSGDYGFRHDGEYYVIGRKKDIIIVAGKNIYPEDIEDVVSAVPGVIPGRVVAFGVEDEDLGTEQVAVVLESEQQRAPSIKALQRAVIGAGMDIGVTIGRVHIVPPRWLIKSSSGKPSRKANQERILAVAQTTCAQEQL